MKVIRNTPKLAESTVGAAFDDAHGASDQLSFNLRRPRAAGCVIFPYRNGTLPMFMTKWRA
jgi:hypothetical protein